MTLSALGRGGYAALFPVLHTSSTVSQDLCGFLFFVSFAVLPLRQSLANVTENTYLNWGGSSLLLSVSAVTRESPALHLAGSTARGVGCVGMLESTGLEKAVKQGQQTAILMVRIMATCLFIGNCSWREWLLCLLLPHGSNCKTQPTDASHGLSSETTLWSVAGLT